MMHRHKALGIAFAAILALSALAAQAASASPLTVNEGGSGTTFYTGDQETTWIFETPEGTSQCPTTSIKASSTGTSVNETSYEATYSNCSGLGFVVMHWNQSNCTYTFTTPTKIKTGEVTWSASNIHIVCAAGKFIEYTPTTFGVSVCTRFIGSQTPTGGHVIGRNAGGPGPNEKDVTLEITLEGLQYTSTGGACGSAGAHSDLKWTGNSTVRAYSNGGHTTQRGIAFS
jgi:hypothetical protein